VKRVRYKIEPDRGAENKELVRDVYDEQDVASACDLVGKRWALQVVRELALGPRRFTDLHQRVAGISTSVLATRLRELEQSGVARRRRLPPPAASMVYELTERGSKLGEIVLALNEWGTRTLAACRPRPDEPE
jgi:DNA-binding HxlR family transcriptional regulator